MMTSQTQRLISWVRYLYWAETERVQFENWSNAQDDVRSPENQAAFIALMSQWYASLWVVVEGWAEVPLSDRIIDNILQTRAELIQMLKRFRNGVFHFQSSVVDNRFLDFLTKAEDAVFLVNGLHHEFLRFLWELPDTCPGTPEQQSRLRSTMHEALGWWPKDIPQAHIEELRRTAAEAFALSYTGTDPSDEGSRDLRATAREAMLLADEALAELKGGFSSWCWDRQKEATQDAKPSGTPQP